jgi:hypothetical protein
MTRLTMTRVSFLISAALLVGCGPAAPATPDLAMADMTPAPDLVPPAVEDLCSDGLDNDGDGQIDCADPDCAGQICRAASGSCDVSESCNAGVCPADVLLSAGNPCRASTGLCDPEETCDGASAQCPTDALAAPSVVCRAGAGPCDIADHCSGLSTDCPADAIVSAGVSCRAPSDLCDAEELCDGTSVDCPADVFADATVVCRPVAGVCDVAEKCTGTSAACPADAFASTVKVCRLANRSDRCDVSERCSGNSPDCGPDLFRPAGFECRAASGGCDSVAEVCAGGTPICPADVHTCQPAEWCDAGATPSACKPKKANSVTCDDDGECLSGRCVDGVCCNSTCTGLCRGCNIAGKEGTCSNHAAGTDPDDDCGAYSCTSSGTCNVTCPAAPPGDVCATQCKPGNRCDSSGKCVPDRGLGQTCTKGCECQSGNCVDGVCCNSACGGPCQACNLAGKVGTCSPHPRGTDPENNCPGGTTGYDCDGASQCLASCTGSACSVDCKSGYYCASGVCVKDKAQGAGCSSGCECPSGFCVDGVCCNNSCSGNCQRCAGLPGQVGTCTSAPSGTDPDGDCGAYLCGPGAVCHKKGACGLGCGVGVCKAAYWCDASGACVGDYNAGAPCFTGCMCKSGSCGLVTCF